MREKIGRRVGVRIKKIAPFINARLNSMFPDRFAPADAHERSWLWLQNAHAESFK